MVQALNPMHASVLIVEDNPDDRLIVAKALETFGIRHVYAVDTAEEAISFLRRQPCDVALVDYHLPRMNGLALLQRLQTAQPDVRVILVTGARDDRVAASALKGGAVDYVSKDEMLTSGIVQSLQHALRDEIAEQGARREMLMEAGSGALTIAREEADWLLETLDGPGRHHAGEGGGPEEWLDLLQAFGRVIAETMRTFPEPAARAEDSLVRMFAQRGASPGDILKVYRATLRALAADERPLRVNPLLALVRIYARVMAEYQLDRSMDAAGRAA